MTALNAQQRFSENLIAKLKEKAGLKSDAALAKFLGINQPSLIGWKSKGVSELQLANAFMSVKKQALTLQAEAIKKAHAESIRPIIEMYPIQKDGVEQAKPAVFAAKGKYRKGLYEALVAETSGVFVFYDTRGRALYTGQTKSNLWNEMNLAFRRQRKGQDIMLVTHPVTEKEFVPANEKVRQPHDHNLHLYQLAAYFSAYAVLEDVVDAVEGLLIRAFPNDTFNTKMEKIKQKAKKGEKQ